MGSFPLFMPFGLRMFGRENSDFHMTWALFFPVFFFFESPTRKQRHRLSPLSSDSTQAPLPFLKSSFLQFPMNRYERDGRVLTFLSHLQTAHSDPFPSPS